ncbi:hypothetical protein [Streptomyces sp. NPDC056670]|uniref:hypothetical protein n=1 Tax=Streptomyces sp. NPDC056670 TaxID=3345904 RepID=UPI0036B89260
MMYRRRSADPDEAARGHASRVRPQPSAEQAPGETDYMAMQRSVGNAAVARMIASARPAASADGGQVSGVFHGGPGSRAPGIHHADSATPVQRVSSSGQPDAKRLEDVLPREEWYRAYLDPLHHEEARQKHPDNPGELYDHQQSPGFQGSMTATYERFLNDPKTIGDRVDFATYEAMHNTVVSQLHEKPDKSGAAGYVTGYPLRADSPTPSVLNETIGGKALMAKADGLLPFGIRPDALTWSGHFEPGVDMMLNQTLYKDSDVEGLVTETLDRFYGKLDAAKTTRERFKAIGWVVRTIHIIHPYDDTNRRLNVHVLLPRLLLASGYQPVIFKDMEELFQGGRSLEQIADALESGQAVNLLSDRIGATDPRYESDWYQRNRPAPRETSGLIEIPTFESSGSPDMRPQQQFAQQAARADDFDFFIEGLGGPGPEVHESGAHREELHEYLTNSLRQAREEAAQDPGLEGAK